MLRSGSMALANPKSQILSRQLLLTRRLPGFRSRWMTPAEWRYLRPEETVREYNMDSSIRMCVCACMRVPQRVVWFVKLCTRTMGVCAMNGHLGPLPTCRAICNTVIFSAYVHLHNVHI